MKQYIQLLILFISFIAGLINIINAIQEKDKTSLRVAIAHFLICLIIIIL